MLTDAQPANAELAAGRRLGRLESFRGDGGVCDHRGERTFVHWPMPTDTYPPNCSPDPLCPKHGEAKANIIELAWLVHLWSTLLEQELKVMIIRREFSG